MIIQDPGQAVKSLILQKTLAPYNWALTIENLLKELQND